jgi:acetate kinase
MTTALIRDCSVLIIPCWPKRASRFDALIFTGGIGENSDIIRKKVITQLGFLGMECDTQANLDARFGQQGIISTEQSRIKAVVMPTNEEWVIALDSANIVKEL